MSRLSLLPKPSTRAFYREAKQSRLSLFDRLHGDFYLRKPYTYIGLAVGEHRLKKWLGPVWKLLGAILVKTHAKGEANGRQVMADTYHGKVVPTSLARQLVTVDREIDVRDLEKIVPYATARDIILKNPDHIVALECPCRAAREHPCLPLDVCVIVGEPFAGFVAEHHPRRSRWIDRDEALGILEAEHQRGHVHHAFFKDAMLGRFYAICNCCSCCCGAMQAYRNGTPMLASSGYVARLEADDCQACGTCAEFCPFEAMSVGENTILIDEARCMGCGVCVSKCENNALRLELEPSKGEPLDLRHILRSGGDGCPAMGMVEMASVEVG